jgi:hypothetical protein
LSLLNAPKHPQLISSPSNIFAIIKAVKNDNTKDAKNDGILELKLKIIPTPKIISMKGTKYLTKWTKLSDISLKFINASSNELRSTNLVIPENINRAPKRA